LDKITFTINNKKVKGDAGSTIIDVAKDYGIPVPTLCHDPCLKPIGACRVCLVEDEKRGNLVAACVTPVSAGMSIRMDSQKVLDARKVVVKLMLASHPESCIVCEKGNRCKLRQIAADLGIGLVDYYPMPNFTGTQELNPFILRDLSKCVLCAKCIRADHELVVEGAIDYLDRGFEARPATFEDGPLEKSECTFCGTCVEMCPTGALFERGKRHRGTATKRTATTCSFCGCGCSLWLEVSSNQVVGVRPGIPGSVNGMTLCVKGHFGYEYISHPDRLKKPLIKKDGNLEEASWDEALQAAAAGLSDIRKKGGKGSMALLAGPHCTNEEAFLMKSFASDVLDTDLMGCSASTYLSTLIQPMKESAGFVGTNGSIRDLEEAEAVLLIGANPTETAPVVGYSIKRGVRKGKTALIVIDPLEIKLTKYAHLWLRPFPGTDHVLLLGFLKFIMENDSFAAGLSGESSQKLNEIKDALKKFSPDDVQPATGVSLESLKEAAQVFCSAARKAIVFGNGVLQQASGQDLIRIICILAQLAKNETTVFPLIKQSNALGSFHMGLMNSPPETIFSEVLKGQIKGLWITGDDPMVSLAGVNQIERALDKLEFLVVCDSFLTGTGQKADVVFPSATFAEKTGTVTSMEGLVQKISPAIDCVGESRPDWLTISNIAELLKSPFGFKSEKDITRDIIKRVPLYKKMGLTAMDNGYFSYRIPLSSSKLEGSIVLPTDIAGLPETDKQYPYKLITGSILFQLAGGYQTKKMPGRRVLRKVTLPGLFHLMVKYGPKPV
jgi:formate dehydrogenase alpha subunit